MNCVKVLHTADCHLGSGRASVPNGKTELKNTFFRILDLCRTENVDFLLIAGDLFDSPFTDRETVSEIATSLAQIPETYVIIVSGNHDCACPDSLYDTFPFPENVRLFTSDIDYFDFPDKNARIYGAGFTTHHKSNSQLSDFVADTTDMICIGVLHGELTVSHDNCMYNPLSPSQIASSKLDYLALGHIHKRSEIMKSGNTFYAYCGCPDGRGFDETGDKGVYIGTVSKGECSLSYLELSSRLYISDRIDISDCTSTHHITECVLEYIKNKYHDLFSDNLYRITLHGSINPDIIINISQIQKELNQFVLYCEVIDKTEQKLTDLEKIASEQTLRGAFTRKMLDKLSSASPDEQHVLRLALKLGLRAFEREVKLYDN